MNKKIAIIMLIVFITAVPRLAFAAASTQLIYRGDTSYNAIALTFDDCNDPVNTQAILDILQKNKVKATFFAVGEAVVADPELFRNMARSRTPDCKPHLFPSAFIPAVLFRGTG